MKILVTGADGPLGGLLCRSLVGRHEVAAAGAAAEVSGELDGCTYRSVDLRDPEKVGELVAGIERIVHALPFDPEMGTEPQAEQELLDCIARGTYVLVTAAVQAQVARLVLISQMGLVEDYPEDFVVNEAWTPLPRAEAVSLAPLMAELTCREIARTGVIEAICLRFGALGAQDGTSEEDAVAAVADALEREQVGRGHSWRLRHVVSGARFAR